MVWQILLKFTTEDSDLLRRAACYLKIGLAISHGGYHRHGAYLLAFRYSWFLTN